MESADVVVVGAGPAGSVAARWAAEGGARTVLIDRRPEIGVPVQCGEFVPTLEELSTIFPFPELLRNAFDLPGLAIERSLDRMVVVAPTGRRYELPVRGMSVSRSMFDRSLAERAERAGAQLRHPLGVTRVRDGAVELANGERIAARVVIGADGPLSVVARSAGYTVPRTMFPMITATSAGPFEDEIRLFFGSVAPGGYAWTIPKRGGANVGLGVARARDGHRLGRLLERFLHDRGLGSAERPTRWWVPIGPPPESAIAGRSLMVGDAANLVMATNGGGIPTAMISGYDAGRAAAAHVRDGRPLSEYDLAWKRHLYAPLARGRRLQRLGERFASFDPLLALGMRYLGSAGLDEMMRLKWPTRLGGAS